MASNLNEPTFYKCGMRLYRVYVGTRNRDICVGTDGKIVQPLYYGDRLNKEEEEKFWEWYKKNGK